MSRIMDLIDRRAKDWEAAKAFLDSKTDANGLINGEDIATYEKMEANLAALDKQIDAYQRQVAYDAALSNPTSKPITNIPSDYASDTKTGRASDAYRKAMVEAVRSNFRVVSNEMTIGTSEDGGYLVPEEWDRRLIESLEEANIMRQLSTTFKTKGEHKINIVSGKPAAAWMDEGEALTFTDAKFKQISFSAHKLGIGTIITEELLSDNAYDLEGWVIRKFAEGLANEEEDVFLNGDGASKPVGIFNADGGGQVGVTATEATTIIADEIINLVYSLKRIYRKKASFIMADQTLGAIRKLKDGNGTYLWQPSYQAGEPDKLLGFPLHTSAFVPTIDDGGAVMAFGDYKYYNIGDRGSRWFTRLNEVFAVNGMVGFMAKERVDGKLILPEAVQILRMKDK